MNKGMKLIYPATKWQDALPLGNGIIGALVYGNIRDELLVINHDRLYLNKYDRPHFDDISHHLPEARKIMLEDNFKAGFDFLMEQLDACFVNAGTTNPYQPFCDIHIETNTQRAFTDYKRELDFETGEAVVRWNENDASFSRRQFVSRANDMIVIELTADSQCFSNIKIGLSAHGVLGATGMGSGNDVSGEDISFDWKSNVDGEYVYFSAVLEDGKKIGAVGRVITENDTKVVKGHKEGISVINIEGAKKILFIMKLIINEDILKAQQRLKDELSNCNETYQQLFKAHRVIHGNLFNTMSLELCSQDDKYNEQLMIDSYNGQAPIQLIQKMHDFGRYLLIASTAQNAMPPNLQGIWNGDYNPAWSSDYHNDENIQMNYWAALSGNLPETMLSLFDYYDSLIDDFKQNARKLYGCRGILLPICNTTHGLIYKPTIWNAWTGGAGWIAWHYYDYYLHTGDMGFLRNRAVPFMYQTALFYLDFFTCDEKGNLLSIPSLSPENVPTGQDGVITANATMDFAIAKQVLSNLLEAYETLGLTEDKDAFKKLLDKIPDYHINEDGAINEWMFDGLLDNYHHRHQSHIYPLFPAIEITQEKDDKMFNAMKVAVEKRLVVGLGSQTGWSLAHMANIYTRLGDGDRALECIELICMSCTGDNLFTYHNDWRSQGITMYWGHGSRPPFQIDANFGITAAVLEMLLFSDQDMIKLLPALPVKWQKGSVTNILCRGGNKASIQWDMLSKTIDANFDVKDNTSFTIKLPSIVEQIIVVGGDANIEASEYGEKYRKITSRKGTLEVSIRLT